MSGWMHQKSDVFALLDPANLPRLRSKSKLFLEPFLGNDYSEPINHPLYSKENLRFGEFRAQAFQRLIITDQRLAFGTLNSIRIPRNDNREEIAFENGSYDVFIYHRIQPPPADALPPEDPLLYKQNWRKLLFFLFGFIFIFLTFAIIPIINFHIAFGGWLAEMLPYTRKTCTVLGVSLFLGAFLYDKKTKSPNAWTHQEKKYKRVFQNLLCK